MLVYGEIQYAITLGICNRIYVKLLQMMYGVITYNSVKKRNLYINKWMSYSHLYWFTAAILSAILEFVIPFALIKLLQIMTGVIPRNLKNDKPFS